jgi:hypothetical protein
MFQFLDKVDAEIDAIGFEVNEAQATAAVGRPRFAGEVYKFR